MSDFEEYIRQSEPHKKEKSYAWQTAIGLQAVDGLKPSEYLIQIARQHIEGDITIDEAKKIIDTYYQSKTVRDERQERTEEADKVSARITEILSKKTFKFSPIEYLAFHRRLFEGIFKFAGQIRNYNITKNEWVLNGQTVLYASATNIRETLDFDFMQEKNFNYKGLPIDEAIRHIVNFVSSIWQIHAFGEGNTRTTAVFTIKYLQTFGFNIDNDAFINHSWYFRNALVRANYNDLSNNVYATTKFLELFFRNLILGEQNELKNRYLSIDISPKVSLQSIQKNISKYHFDTLKYTLEELALLRCINENPRVTQTEIAQRINKSIVTVKRLTIAMTEKGIIERKNGKRNGYWELNTTSIYG